MYQFWDLNSTFMIFSVEIISFRLKISFLSEWNLYWKILKIWRLNEHMSIKYSTTFDPRVWTSTHSLASNFTKFTIAFLNNLFFGIPFFLKKRYFFCNFRGWWQFVIVAKWSHLMVMQHMARVGIFTQCVVVVVVIKAKIYIYLILFQVFFLSIFHHGNLLE